MALHGYEKIAQEALKLVSGGPWTAGDLVRARDIIDSEFCQQHQSDCDGLAVIGWLDSLDDAQQEELLFEVNSDWSAGQDPWALGSR
jgi:hypothetical protein